MNEYVRPPWTCGRYNAEHNVALMYNLIEGQSYFFEGPSTAVIGAVLSSGRNGMVSCEFISNTTGIHLESVMEFMQTLMEVGLIADHIYTKDEIRSLQMSQGKAIISDWSDQQTFGDGNVSTYDVTSAEQAYSDALDKNRYIPSMMFELTYNCSEKCIHCYNDGASRNDSETSYRSRDELTLEDYKSVIDQLYDLGLYKVCLTGGDPFSKPIVWEIIDYLYQRDIAFDILTNGQKLSSTELDRLVNYFPRFVGLSVYSADESVHDRITRVKGSLKRTLKVAEHLSTYGVPMSFKCVIFKTNVQSYQTVKELAANYGAAPQFELNLCNGVGGDVSVVKNLGLPADVIEVVLRDPDVPIHVSSPDGENDVYYLKDTNNHPCRAGIDAFNITPEGELTPCCAFPTSCGNVKERQLSDV